MGFFGGKKGGGGTFRIERGTLIASDANIRMSNAIIAGRPSPGRSALLLDLAADSLQSGIPVVIIQNGALIANNNLLDTFTSYTYGGNTRSLYNMMTRVHDNGGIDLLSGRTNEEKVDWIMDLMKSMSDMEWPVEEFMRLYLTNLVSIIGRLADSSLEFSFRTLKFFTTDWMRNKISVLLKKGKINMAEKGMYIEFIDKYVPMRAQHNRYLYYCTLLDSYGLAESLSRGKCLSELMKGVNVTHFLLNFHAQPQISLGLTKVIIHYIIDSILMDPNFRVTIICEEMDIAKISEFRDLLSACNTRLGCNLFFTEHGISTFQARCGTSQSWDPTGFTNCYFVFQQTQPQDREFWAEVSGMHKVQQATVQEGKFMNSGGYDKGS
jgi:hypothetical protein